MATIVLGAAGAALGGSIGGSVLGLSTAVVGRAVGATLGRVIDDRILGAGSEPVETGRVDRLRLTGASEGAPVGRVYGQMRVAGQVIWASNFREETETSGGGKGRPQQPSVTEYSYSVSLAIAVCEGEITRIARVWADGREISPQSLNMTVYYGSEDQLPDPKIEAVEGADNAPAYRGIAYVVFEDLQLGQFGNRVPSFSFEVLRPGQPGDLGEDGVTPPDMARALQAVNLLPGSGEYALATSVVEVDVAYGETGLANVHTASGEPDAIEGLNALQEELPNCGSVSLIVSWMGDDLRVDQCTLRPKVEQDDADGSMSWRVTGLTRSTALLVPELDNEPVYGGTPTDQSVVEIIQEMTARGLDTVFYPFILMDQIDGNTLIDPYTGTPGQPVLPWRGRITTSLAPGVPGSPDATVAAKTEVDTFFGTCQPSDFTINGNTVDYSGPVEWSYRRFILHYAHLCAAAGGVDAFCIGTEMRGLTWIRDAVGSYPAVDQLKILAAEVKAILPGAKISYAADWSEYFGHQPDGTDDRYFHLDPLWADSNIDFIAIDNYMPLSDWRDNEGHADEVWGSIYNLDYLRANVEGGEGYDFFYASEADRTNQVRTPITDGLGQEWMFRYKDMRGWWENQHFDRVGGVPAAVPSPWVPQSKPIWFTEFGCSAVDKGTNQPNKFIDPKSSESFIPYFSRGWRDEYIQMQYIRATIAHWSDPANNPVSPVYGQPMIDMSRAHIWAWDARPFPSFPARLDIWSDGDNWELGHWITGRTAARPLADVVEELCAEVGLTDVDTSELYGLVRGYTVDRVTSIRAALQPLMLAYGFDAIERDGGIAFRTRTGDVAASLTRDQLAIQATEDEDVRRTRAAEAEIAGRVKLDFIASGGSYEAGSVEVVAPGDSLRTVTTNEMPLVLTRDEGRGLTERWLAEARVARDTVTFALPPSRQELGAGDIVALDDGEGQGLYRIDRLEIGLDRQAEATRIEAQVYDAVDPGVRNVRQTRPQLPVATEAVFMDLPLLTGEEVEHTPHFTAVARPWPGQVALYQSATDSGYSLDQIRDAPGIVGVTETVLEEARPGRWDYGPALRVRLLQGALSSAEIESVLAGANLAAIGDGSTDAWEVFQFAMAEMVDDRTYDIQMRLRGQRGSDGVMPANWPVGSIFVLLNGRVSQVTYPSSARATTRYFRWGPADRALDHRSYRGTNAAFDGNGLRPYPVAHLRQDTDSGTYAYSWIRRTRIDGDIWDGGEVPVGEASESYRVRVRSGGTLLRETFVSSPSFAYSAAERAADGLSVGQTFMVNVAQMSDRYGAGPVTQVQSTA